MMRVQWGGRVRVVPRESGTFTRPPYFSLPDDCAVYPRHRSAEYCKTMMRVQWGGRVRVVPTESGTFTRPPYFSFLWAQVEGQPGTLLSSLEGLQAGQTRLRNGEAAIRREVLHLAAMRELVVMYISWLSAVLHHSKRVWSE
jgi:hypothetical protein